MTNCVVELFLSVRICIHRCHAAFVEADPTDASFPISSEDWSLQVKMTPLLKFPVESRRDFAQRLQNIRMLLLETLGQPQTVYQS